MLGWFWLQGRLSPGWGLVLASSWRDQRWQISPDTTATPPLQSALSSPQLRSCWRPWKVWGEEMWYFTIAGIWPALQAAGWRREEGDQAVDSKPGGRVVLPRLTEADWGWLSININNPSHRPRPHHYTTEWHISEKHSHQLSQQDLGSNFYYTTSANSPLV